MFPKISTLQIINKQNRKKMNLLNEILIFVLEFICQGVYIIKSKVLKKKEIIPVISLLSYIKMISN